MDYGLILARIIHVVAGVLWLGALWFVTIFLAPTLAELGPDAGKFMAGLAKRKLMVFLPLVAVLTILSGLYLYWKVSMGFTTDYMNSRTGRVFGLGGLLAIVAFAIGMTVTRPAMIKSMKLGQTAATASPEDREPMLREAQALRDRSASWSRIILILMLGSGLSMAIARYV